MSKILVNLVCTSSGVDLQFKSPSVPREGEFISFSDQTFLVESVEYKVGSCLEMFRTKEDSASVVLKVSKV